MLSDLILLLDDDMLLVLQYSVLSVLLSTVAPIVAVLVRAGLRSLKL